MQENLLYVVCWVSGIILGFNVAHAVFSARVRRMRELLAKIEEQRKRDISDLRFIVRLTNTVPLPDVSVGPSDGGPRHRV